MDLAELQKIGGFVPSEPVKVKVDWNPPEGEPVSFDVHVRKLSAGALERLWVDTRADQSSSATMISQAVMLGDKADQRLTYEQAFTLEPSLATALLEAVDQVNPRKKRTVAAAKN